MASMNTVRDFIKDIERASKLAPKDASIQLTSLLRLHPAGNSWVARLYNAGTVGETETRKEVEQHELFGGQWPAFESLMESFIRLSNQLNPGSAAESFDLYATFLNDLTVAFTNKAQGYLLSEAVQESFSFVIPIAAQLDYQLRQQESNRRPRLAYMAALLLKIFNNIRSQLGGGDRAEAAKKSIMLFVGVRLCVVYFKLSKPLLCRNVFSNMSNAGVSLQSYPRNQQLQYRYYLARFYMVKNQFIDAYQHLQWCLASCPRDHLLDNVNVTRILRYLIPVGVLVGRCPRIEVIRQTFYSSPALSPEFLTVYSELVGAIKRGSFRDFCGILEHKANHEFLKENSLLIVLSQKAPVIIIRNLVRKVWRICGAQSRLDYDSVRRGLSHSLAGIPLSAVTLTDPAAYAGDTVDLDDYSVENCLVMLIDQNLLKGKIFSRLRLVSLSKTEVFPRMDTIAFIKFGHGGEGILSSSEKWMQ